MILYVTEMGKGQPSLQGQLRTEHLLKNAGSSLIYVLVSGQPFPHDRIISLESVTARNIIDALIFEILSHLCHHKNS